MAPRKSSRRGRGKSSSMFESTLEDLKSSIDALGKLVSSYMPGGATPKKRATSSRKAAATSAKKRATKTSPRRKPASARAARGATQKA